MRTLTHIFICLLILFVFESHNNVIADNYCKPVFHSFGKKSADIKSNYYKTSIFASIPTSESEYYSIFGNSKIYSRVKEYEMIKAKEQFEKNNLSVTFAGNKNNKKRLKEFIEGNPNRCLFFVGHNVKGFFKFPNGKGVSLQEISDICEKHNKIPILLSCGSYYFTGNHPITTQHELSYIDAKKIIDSIESNFKEKLSYMEDIDKKNISEEIDNFVSVIRISENRRGKVRASIVGGCVLIAVNFCAEDLK